MSIRKGAASVTIGRKGKIDPKANARRAAVHKSRQKIRKANKAKPGRKKFGPYRRNLGPMGTLGWDVIIEVSVTVNPSDAKLPNKTAVSSIVDNFNNLFIRNMVSHEIFRPLAGYLWGPDRTLKSTADQGTGIIHINAPEDTGKLKTSLLQGLITSKSTIDRFPSNPFLMELGTPDVEYAKVVNKMPTSWLRHPKKPGKNRKLRKNQIYGREGDLLDDPQARQGWFNLILLNGRNKARQLYDAFKKKIVGMLNPLKSYNINTSNFFDTIFKVKFK